MASGSEGRCAVVAGATGITGYGLIEVLRARGWDVVALSRGGLDMAGVRSIAVDLTDADQCRARLSGLSEATHIFYTGRYDHAAGVPEPIDLNVAMLRNVVEPIEPVARGLRHVNLVHGTKYYASNLGPFPNPAREDAPRSLVNNFYYEQQDWLAARQEGKDWTWSVVRPHGLLHAVPDRPRNLVLVVAVYALICREAGLPLCFPGTPENYRALYQCTSVDQLAESMVWMSEEPACANEDFNITNGDLIRWCNLWPMFAEYFGMETGPVKTVRLATTMPGTSGIWERLRARHNLSAPSFERLVLWDYGDFVFTPYWDIASDLTKARQAGFHRTRRTFDEFVRYFEEFRRRGLLPPD